MTESKGNNSKSITAELWFLRSARHLMLIDIYMKFREDSLNGFQVIERTRVWQTDKRPGTNNVPPNPKGGDIITNEMTGQYRDIGFDRTMILILSLTPQTMYHLN